MEAAVICTSVDDRYLWPWMVMIFSGVTTCNRNFPRVILANINGMLSSENQIIALDFAKALNIDLEIVSLQNNAELEFEHHFNFTIYSRILLMEMLLEDFLWLDSDLILMPGWDQIFDEEGDKTVENIVLRGVLDSKISRDHLLDKSNQAMLQSQGRYINSGVLLMSPDNWRKIPNRENWISMAKKPKDYEIRPNDQDILNLLCAGRISLLPSRYNYIVGDFHEINDPLLIHHFAGPPKPWKLTRREKEYLLGSQGFNYFKKKNWITYFSDTFLFYPNYWNLEEEVIGILRLKNLKLAESILILRSNHSERSDFMLSIKHFCMSIFFRKWR